MIAAVNTNNNMLNIMTRESVFTDTECDVIIELSKKQDSQDGITQGGDANLRDSQIKWINSSDDSAWLYAKLQQIAGAANKFYQFNIHQLESIQLAEYSNGGHYGWHRDLGAGRQSMRKFSISVQLSDEGSYEGGALEFFSIPVNVPKARGSVVIFPSYISHRVNPVTHGTRLSLVTWVLGAPFK